VYLAIISMLINTLNGFRRNNTPETKHGENIEMKRWISKEVMLPYPKLNHLVTTSEAISSIKCV
jgi:hypothetical protein